MFDRFIRLARARRALAEGRFEAVIPLADDPMIREDRRARDFCSKAQKRLVKRALERLQAGQAAAAVRDLEAALQAGAHPQAEAALAAARQQLQQGARRREEAQQALQAARAMAERGQLGAAESAARAALDQSVLAPAVQGLQTFLDGRKDRVSDCLQRARKQLAAGQVGAAVEEIRTARALNSDVEVSWLPELVAAAAERLVAELVTLGRRRDWIAALAAWRRWLSTVPELASNRVTGRAGERLAKAVRRHLARADGAVGDLVLVRAAAAEPALPGEEGSRLAAGAKALQRAASLRAGGRTADLAAALLEAGEALASANLAREGREVGDRLGAADVRLARARAKAAEGELGDARDELHAILEEWPMHGDARAELDAIEDGLRQRDERLHAVRLRAKEGLLRQAYAEALALSVPGSAGDQARRLAKDLRARIDVVGRGLDQVRAALHGRDTAGVVGLRHCRSRLDELAKVCADHEEIPRLCAALDAEISAIEQCELGAAALRQGRFGEACAVIDGVVRSRPQLLAEDRIDARLLELVDGLWAAAEEALSGGRLGQMELCLGGVEAAAVIQPEVVERVASLRGAAQQRRERAEVLVQAARQRLAQRDLAGAEERCDKARQLWVDAPVGRKLEDEMRSIRRQELTLEKAAAMAREGDVDGAQAEMGGMAPTPAMLRTRIFDMKQSLARAQGLEQGFLLRVDEGGEFVVLRGESVSIGNLRDGSADLPVLAAIAGCHARVERAMSFHGGMQDTIRAEAGEVYVDGRRVDRHRLRPGDRVRLGSSLQLGYQLPCTRSLTASLQLLGGFMVAGTDRLLLMKDRGRDGRILIGASRDVHVRVPVATSEVEIYSNRSGQVRVRCDAGGEIDGRPFRGEHPVSAGATVTAGGVTLVLLPWNRR